MIAGVAYRSFGVVAFDSKHRAYLSDGSVSYFDGPPVLASFDHGWVTASGNLHVATAAEEELSDSEGGTLEDLAKRLAPVLQVACSEVADSPGVDPARSRVLLLTARSGGIEMGLLSPRGGLQRIPPGNRVFSSPGGTSHEAAVELWEARWAETPTPRSGYTVFRYLAQVSHELSDMTPAVSGNLRLGILQKAGPTAPWEAVRLEGRAEELAQASDADLSNALRMEAAV